MPLGIKVIQFSTLKEWAANLSFSVINCLRQLIFYRKGISFWHTSSSTEKLSSHWSNTFPYGLTKLCVGFGQYPGILGHHPNKRYLRIFLQLGWASSLGTGEIPGGNSYCWVVRPGLMQLFTQSLKVKVWTKQSEQKKRKGGMMSFQV